MHAHHEGVFDTEVFKLIDLNELKAHIQRIFNECNRRLPRQRFFIRLNMCRRYQEVNGRPQNRTKQRWQQILNELDPTRLQSSN